MHLVGVANSASSIVLICFLVAYLLCEPVPSKRPLLWRTAIVCAWFAAATDMVAHIAAAIQ